MPVDYARISGRIGKIVLKGSKQHTLCKKLFFTIQIKKDIFMYNYQRRAFWSMLANHMTLDPILHSILHHYRCRYNVLIDKLSNL